MKTLMAARHTAAVAEVSARYQEFMNGRGTIEILFGAAQRLLHAELDLLEPTNQVQAWENHHKLLKEIFQVQDERFKAQRIPIQDVKQAEFYMLDAELHIENLKHHATAPRR
jgi:hypothetical protein